MYSYFIPLFLILFLLLTRERRKRLAVICHTIHKKKRMETVEMEELAKRFVGKDCLIYSVSDSSSYIQGNIREVTNGGILVEAKDGLQAVSLEFVTRIREYPKNKKGKKKSVILD